MTVYYMNGAGNDFMVIDARGQNLDFSALALELCKLSGADGFLAVDYSALSAAGGWTKTATECG